MVSVEFDTLWNSLNCSSVKWNSRLTSLRKQYIHIYHSRKCYEIISITLNSQDPQQIYLYNYAYLNSSDFSGAINFLLDAIFLTNIVSYLFSFNLISILPIMPVFGVCSVGFLSEKISDLIKRCIERRILYETWFPTILSFSFPSVVF